MNSRTGDTCDGFLCCLSRFGMEDGGDHISIKAADGAFTQTFIFPCGEGGGAWYELDGAASASDGAALKLNADREVYAVYVSDEGVEKYGTIGDGEDETLADNFPFSAGDVYLFHENPDTEDYYV